MLGALKNIGASFSGVGTSLVPVAQSTAMKTGEDAMMDEGGEQELSPMEQFVEVLQGMYDSLLTIRDDIAYIAGAQILEERGSGADERDIAIGAEDRGEDDKEEDKEKSGILTSLAGIFKGLDMGYGDKMNIDDVDYRWVDDRIKYYRNHGRLLTKDEMRVANYLCKKYKA